jgi:hypothetical protein
LLLAVAALASTGAACPQAIRGYQVGTMPLPRAGADDEYLPGSTYSVPRRVVELRRGDPEVKQDAVDGERRDERADPVESRLFDAHARVTTMSGMGVADGLRIAVESDDAAIGGAQDRTRVATATERAVHNHLAVLGLERIKHLVQQDWHVNGRIHHAEPPVFGRN